MTWNSSSPATTPPNGSSAGIAALVADTTGQIDCARSSRGPNPGETNTMNFWAYALGALDFVTFPGTHAPAAGLTQAQLISIYTCDPARTAVRLDWSQVGGKPGAIVKYAPQTGSGTYSFFNSKLLNGSTIDTELRRLAPEHLPRGARRSGRGNGDKPQRDLRLRLGPFRAQKRGFERTSPTARCSASSA